MEPNLLQFCTCGEAELALLKERIDACGAAEHSYEFAGCRLFPGCRPERVTLGFWRDDGGYLFYLSTPVEYRGEHPVLSALFQAGGRRFPTFDALARWLRELGRAAEEDSFPTLFLALKNALRAHVAGQDRAIEAAAFRLYGHIYKPSPARPLSLILYGPTGVGKSELGKQVAPVLNSLLGSERYRFVWTELNTFTESHSVYRLTGAPPGYAGYDDRPVFESVCHNPYTVFMFDELEKAHPEVLKAFMSILDEGRCAARREDKEGNRELDFRRCIFLFTTNADLSREGGRLGFAQPEGGASLEPKCSGGEAGMSGLSRRLFLENERARQALVRSGVLREIAGRFSGLIPFQPLGKAARAEIAGRQVAALGREYGLQVVHVAPAIAEALGQWTDGGGGLSVRSSVCVIEGALTPLFLSRSKDFGGAPVRLSGTLEAPVLLPAGEALPLPAL